jgi:peptidyl-prolyl cis-trans isomerase SurA
MKMHWTIKILKLFPNRMKHLTAGVILLMLASLPLTHAGAQDNEQNQGFVVDEIIAKVDNHIILKSEVDRMYQDYLTNGNSPSQGARCEILALITRNKLMLAKAEIDSVIVLDAEVDLNTQRRMDIILSQSGKTPDELEAIYGKPLEQIRAELRDQIREQMIVQKMEDEITADLAVTPAEVKRFFNRIPKDSLPYFSASVEVAQIVKEAKTSAEQKAITRNQLLDIRSRILANEDFATLAKKYSDDPSVLANRGEMGWVGRGRLVPEYEAVAFRLKPGEVSMPFESPFGMHIVQLIERRGNEYNSRHILISPKPSEEDLKKASAFLDSLRTLIVKDSLVFEKVAKEYSDDVSTKGSGGFFTDSDGGFRLTVDELDPVVFFKIDSLEVGNVSRPIVYRTDEGKAAVRVLYYKSRIPPHQASLQDDYHKIQIAALNEKKNQVLEKWFINARKDVFINVDNTYDYCGILN